MAEDFVPFTTFNFKALFQVPGEKDAVCSAQFSECDGLEMSMQPKTIREGGNSGMQIHLCGPVSYGQVTLKRGMTNDFGLWKWFERVQRERRLRASGDVRILSPDRKRTDVHFALVGCLPVKLKAPGLNGKDGMIAIEEMQIAYESLRLVTGGGQ